MHKEKPITPSDGLFTASEPLPYGCLYARGSEFFATPGNCSLDLARQEIRDADPIDPIGRLEPVGSCIERQLRVAADATIGDREDRTAWKQRDDGANGIQAFRIIGAQFLRRSRRIAMEDLHDREIVRTIFRSKSAEIIWGSDRRWIDRASHMHQRLQQEFPIMIRNNQQRFHENSLRVSNKGMEVAGDANR